MNEEQLNYLRQIVKGKSRQQIIDLMYEKFGIKYTPNQIKRIKEIHNIKSGKLGISRPNPKEHIDYLKEIYQGRKVQEVTDMMNKKFGTNYTTRAVEMMKWRNNLKSHYGRLMQERPECLEFLKENAKGKSQKEIQKLFNEHFDMDCTLPQIKGFLKYYQLKTETGGKFEKGHVSFNRKPIGSEHYKGNKNRCKMVYIKVAQPNVWVRKNRYVYEQHYGKIPDDYRVIHLNGDKDDFSIDNLRAIPLKTHLVMKNMNLYSNDKDLFETGILITKVAAKRNEVMKKFKEQLRK